MMIDLDVLKKCGIDYDSLRRTFETKPVKGAQRKDDKGKILGGAVDWANINDKTKKGKLDGLKKLISSRIQDGRAFNLTNHKTYKALDDAWDVPLKQITPTMLTNLIDSELSDDKKIEQLKAWGMSPEDMMTEVADPKAPGKTLKKLSAPAFHRVFVPLVRSYLTIRWAKIMNDRRLVPFLKYEPAISDQINRTRCEVITQRVEAMSKQYGYYNTVKDAVWRMLTYSECFQFPVEPWNEVCQLAGKDAEAYQGAEVSKDVENADGKKETVVIGKKVVMKEGLRYHLPHPTRTFYDRAWFPNTFNTDSGSTFAGYWRVMRYREIMANKEFYNLNTISYGDAGWFETNASFFTNVYPCALKFPPMMEDRSGKSKFDSEAHLSDGFYTSDQGDAGCMLTELFMKLVPSEHGMGDYDYPVWFRFVIAGDDTIVYCAPLPYCPVVYYGYDNPGGRVMNSSLAMEILPFQDQFSNLLSQYILTVRQNLFNLTLVDTDVVDEKDAKNMEGWANKLWTGINVVRFSMRKLFKMGSASGAGVRALYPEKLPQMDTSAIAQSMRMILEILERVLVMSSQEVGQPASHEQTREEVRNIASNTSVRLQFTAANVDEAREAMKNQLYQALMAYGTMQFYAQIPADPTITNELLEKNGFTVVDDKLGAKEQKKIVTYKDRTAIQMFSFASSRDGDDRINDGQLAQTMGQWMVQLLGNPMMATALGPEQGVKMANMIARLSGFPRDFKLINRGPDMTPEENNQEIMTQVQQFVEQVMGSMKEEFQQGLVPIMQENQAQTQQIQAIAANQQQLSQQVGEMEQMLSAGAQAPNVAPMPAQPADPIAAAVPKVNPEVMAGVM